MSATEYLNKAVEYDKNGRKLESLKLYFAGIQALLDTSKSKIDFFFSKFKNYLKQKNENFNFLFSFLFFSLINR